MALPYRVCDECGGVDDHPRHVIAGVILDVHPPKPELKDIIAQNAAELVTAGKIDVETAMRLAADYADTTSVDLHMDCCAARGCPTGTCGVQLHPQGKTGESLRKHILSDKNPLRPSENVAVGAPAEED